jgi:starch-binding outer membrane protein, SusD/RagB family
MANTSHRNVRRLGATCFVAVAFILIGCSRLTDPLLNAHDPDNIPSGVTQGEAGAEGLRLGAVFRLVQVTAGADTSGKESVWLFGGFLTDEWKSGDTFAERIGADSRSVPESDDINERVYRDVQRARLAADQAIAALVAFKPTAKGEIGEMYFIKAYTLLELAESYCNGQALGSYDEQGKLVYGERVTNDALYQMALAATDAGLTAVGTANDALSVSARNALRVTKGRTLMDMKQYAQAATAVAAVSTDYEYLVTFKNSSIINNIWELNIAEARYVVGDSVDALGVVKNAIPFVSSGDPRVPTDAGGRAFDSTTPWVGQLIWSKNGPNLGDEDPVAVVNGIDARMIESEARLAAGDVAGWLSILNTLRTGPTKVSEAVTIGGPIGETLKPLADPGTADKRLSLQFREKAFWTFGRGERLGDLRRLVRQYGRASEQVFPTGAYFKGGNYGPDVNLPVPQAELNNPNFKGCIDRGA